MKQKITWVLLMGCLLCGSLYSQTLTQTLRGTVLDADTRQALIGAHIRLFASDGAQQGAISDENGQFRFESVPVGRLELQISYLGYEELFVPNIVLHSGKEVVLQLDMREALHRINEVTITASRNKGEALHEMALLSSRSISPEETNRYAGGFNDPSRILSNFAGVTSTQDGSNDIIVRGNSPKYVQWRLEGEQITNPNHFGDQSAVGGSVSILNNNLLAASDFHTGAFAPEFGDALSGVYDLRLRNGNNEKLEAIFGIGLLGTELTLEGPFKKGYGGSFLVNYRYSTVDLISQLGLVDGVSGVLKFQDASFKMIFPTQKAGVFSIYGIAGRSSFELEDVTPALWVTPGDNTTLRETRNDLNKNAHLLNAGIKHTFNLGSRGYLNTVLSYSNEGIEDELFEAGVIRFYDDTGEHLRDSILDRRPEFNSRIRRPIYRVSSTYHLKLDARNKIQIGTKYALFDYKATQRQYRGDAENLFTLLDATENIDTWRNFISWKFRSSEKLQFVAGIHHTNVLLNHKSTIEPRLAMEYAPSPDWAIQAGYGRHSTMESIHHYFARVEDPDGHISEPNRDLDLLKADHFVLGIERRLGKDMRAKVELYYQRLFNLPVENLDTSYFATIVEGLDFRYVDLVNAGKGRNYGVEITLEKFFSRNYYFLLNASLFESKYTPLDGVERNTPFNGQYLVNLLAGREFPRLGRKENQLLAINAKAFLGGARRIIPLLRDANGHLAVNPAAGQVWDYSRAFEAQLDAPYQIQLSLSYKWQKPQATHELFLNLDNITNHKGRIMEFYDESEPDHIGYMAQFGFFPNLMYRVYF